MRLMKEVLESYDSMIRKGEYRNERIFLLQSGLMKKNQSDQNRERFDYVLTERGMKFRDKFMELHGLIRIVTPRKLRYLKSDSDGRDDILEAEPR